MKKGALLGKTEIDGEALLLDHQFKNGNMEGRRRK
jgi:hypothetical protein